MGIYIPVSSNHAFFRGNNAVLPPSLQTALLLTIHWLLPHLPYFLPITHFLPLSFSVLLPHYQRLHHHCVLPNYRVSSLLL